MLLLIFWPAHPPPTPPAARSVAATTGGSSSEFRRDGHRAKPLPRNAAFAGRHIPRIGLLPDRCPTPGWRCFHRHFSPNCPPQVQKRYFFTFSYRCSHREARLPSYYFIQVCVAWISWQHHHLDPRVPGLPGGQDPPPHTPGPQPVPIPQ